MAMGFFAVFDDIAALLDDAAAMSKIATKKTAGVLGDDLAVGAEKASGFSASRELPVLWAIAKGSLRNKLIILPFAFVLSAFAAWSIVPILMLGGFYLAFEGAEKIYEYFVPHQAAIEQVKSLSEKEILAYEAKKVKSAILTDFILSIEIIIIALGTVMEKPLPIQIVVVSFIALIATVGVYGFVALLVRMDDLGFKMIEISGGKSGILKSSGEILVVALPKVIKALTIVGTLAMLLVAGGIFVHNLHMIHEVLHFIPGILLELLVGLVAGGFVLAAQKLFMKLKNRKTR
jgi:predicted DNA repair protein MutK